MTLTLQVLKEVMSHARSTEHKHADIFADTFDKLRTGDVLKKSLFSQLKSVLSEIAPNRDSLGKYFSEDVVASWSYVNLRELVIVFCCSWDINIRRHSILAPSIPCRAKFPFIFHLVSCSYLRGGFHKAIYTLRL
jgi:hypothetical protein